MRKVLHLNVEKITISETLPTQLNTANGDEMIARVPIKCILYSSVVNRENRKIKRFNMIQNKYYI